MSFRLVESYDDSSDLLTVEGRSFPAQCLVEDDEGLRWFLTQRSDVIPTYSWIKAASSGAAALLCPGEIGFAAMTVETFMDARREVTGGYAAPESWSTFVALPGYAELLAAPAYGVIQPNHGFDRSSAHLQSEAGLVHLHTHSEYSLLDGLSTLSEVVAQVVAQGGTHVGITDHGNCAGHPDLQAECDKAGLKPVFGMEAYLVDDRLIRAEDFDVEWERTHTSPEFGPDVSAKDKAAALKEIENERTEARKAFTATLRDYYHLTLVALDQTGLHNLWAMSTESFRDGFYYKPRMDWDTLAKYSEGVAATTACLRGPLCHHALLDGDEQAARARLGRLLDIFGDRLYVEIHTNQLPEQIKVNHQLVTLAREHSVPLLAAVDSHYAAADDRQAHRTWLSVQTNADVADETTLFAGGQDYHLKTEAEVREALAYLGDDVVEEAIVNTSALASACTATMIGSSEPPVYSRKGGAAADAERLLDLCMANWAKTEGKRESQEVYWARFEREFDLLVRKGFCGYYLMTSEQTRWAKANKILVGPGRGSGGGSLVAYLALITDIDPVEADLLFERFMTEGRTSLPDFDVDYPASKKRIMQQHARDVYGEDAVTVVGSVLRLKNKGVVKKLGTALKSQLPEDFFRDQQAISAIIDAAEADTAGLGLSWDDLWAKAGEELQPFRDSYPDLFDMADHLVGRVNTFGQHAAGLIISPEGSLANRLPLRRAEDDGHMIAQFDKDVLEELGYVKFDLLTLRTLDTIQETIDLIEQRRGRRIDVYSWTEEYNDPQVWEEVAEAHTLGIFQIETNLGTRYAKQMRPQSLADLADLVTIVRPGPRNSKLTDTYLARREGVEAVTYPDPRLETVLAKTYGCLLYQEDIMQTCMVLGGYDSNEADQVRKILGKKKVELVAAAGQEFVSRVVERGMGRAEAEALWAQMAEFAKYSFNRAHAYAYAVLGYWTAWLKFHYPVEFLTAALSSIDKDRIPDFVKEARRMGYQVLPPDINESGVGFKPGPLTVRYGLDSIKGIGIAAEHIMAAQPFASFEDFMARVVEPKGSKVNKGHVATLARIGAFDSLVPNRRGLEQMLLAEKTGEASRCVFKVDTIPVGAPNNLPCTYDWEAEPDPINPRTGKKTKRKAPPKKCTKACRHYTAPPPMQVEEVEPYTDVDVREIEAELLGVYLSSTPFDMLAPDDRQMLAEQAELALSEYGPQMLYVLGGVMTKVRPHKDSTGREMGFIAIETEAGVVDAVVFNSAWVKYKRDLKVGGFYAVEVERNARGFNLYAAMPYTRGES